MAAEQKTFPFPEDLTRRERWLFEKHAGITLPAFLELLKNDPNQLSTQMETALLLIAVKRVRPSVTFDQCLDSDWELDRSASRREADDPEQQQETDEQGVPTPPPFQPPSITKT